MCIRDSHPPTRPTDLRRRPTIGPLGVLGSQSNPPRRVGGEPLPHPPVDGPRRFPSGRPRHAGRTPAPSSDGPPGGRAQPDHQSGREGHGVQPPSRLAIGHPTLTGSFRSRLVSHPPGSYPVPFPETSGPRTTTPARQPLWVGLPDRRTGKCSGSGRRQPPGREKTVGAATTPDWLAGQSDGRPPTRATA